MIRYKNMSPITKTFYGVAFRPGEENTVPGFINDPKFVRVPDKPAKPLPRPAVIKPAEPKAVDRKGKAKSEMKALAAPKTKPADGKHGESQVVSESELSPELIKPTKDNKEETPNG